MALYLGEGDYTPASLRDAIVSNSTLIQAQSRSKIQQYDSMDIENSFHLLYSGNWSDDGAQKIFSIAASGSTQQCRPMFWLMILGMLGSLL